MFRLLLLALLFFRAANAQEYQKTYGSYFGPSAGFSLKMSELSDGNFLIGGGITQVVPPYSYYDQFCTPGTFQPYTSSYNQTGFFASLSVQGSIQWSSYLPGYPEVSEPMENGFVVAFTSMNCLTEIGTISPYDNCWSSIYGMAAFSNQGSLLWGMYYPDRILDIALSPQGEIYFFGVTGENPQPFSSPESWMNIPANYNQITRNFFLGKCDLDGNIIARTYLGTAYLSSVAAIAFDDDGNVIVGHTDYVGVSEPGSYAGSGSYQTVSNGENDMVISKFNPDLSERLWSTYFGGNLSDDLRDLIYHQGKIYVAGFTYSTDGISTTGNTLSGLSDSVLATFDSEGQLDLSDYFGGSGSDGITELKAENGNLWLCGATTSSGLEINTNTGLQGPRDGFVALLDENYNQQMFLYVGGSGLEIVSGIQLSNSGFNIYGFTSSPDNIATPNALQPNLLNETGVGMTQNVFFQRYEPTLSITQHSQQKAVIFPNPGNGAFTVTGLQGNLRLECCDALGRKLGERSWESTSVEHRELLDFRGELASGIYVARIFSDGKLVGCEKIVVR